MAASNGPDGQHSSQPTVTKRCGWDTTAPGFAAEALRQGRIVGESYAAGAPDAELIDFWERIADEDRQDVWR
jgi:hypothetical protein